MYTLWCTGSLWCMSIMKSERTTSCENISWEESTPCEETSFSKAWSSNGKAKDCKSLNGGSIPPQASLELQKKAHSIGLEPIQTNLEGWCSTSWAKNVCREVHTVSCTSILRAFRVSYSGSMSVLGTEGQRFNSSHSEGLSARFLGWKAWKGLFFLQRNF